MLSRSYEFDEVLSTQFKYIKILREENLALKENLCELTRECDILREWYVNVFNEEIKKEWI